MLKKYFYLLRRSDWLLVVAAIFLVAMGIVAIYSVEATDVAAGLLNFKKQMIFLGAGLILMVVFSLLDYRYLKTYSLVLYILGIIILLAVFVIGTTIKGTKGWIFLFGEQGFQPVELVKIFLIIIMAKYFSNWRAEVSRFKDLLTVAAVAAPLIILVFLQPDFGSAFVLVVIVLGMLFMTKIKKTYIILIGVFLVGVIIFNWLFVFQDYQKDRVLNFIDPSRDPYGSGYNIKQSIIAVGSGEFFGRGLLLGPQSRLNFLPVQETDFIFAVVAEQLGFVGVSLMLVVMFVLLYRLFKICRDVRDDFGVFFISGVIIYIFVQSLLNIGMNVGLLPIAGLPLPFISYGGSSLIISFIMLGIVQSIKVRHNKSIRV